MAGSSYDEIASEYYDKRHKTCRNFDNATVSILKKGNIFDCKDGKVLEVGAGRGRVGEYLNVNPSNVVQLDNSSAMLDLHEREECSLRILADACDIPLISEQFDFVTGFLVDPFWGLAFLTEAIRMLKRGGRILLTIPTYEWGEALRSKLSTDLKAARFQQIETKNIISLPSTLASHQQIKDMMEAVGFRSINILSSSLAEDDHEVSEDIVTAAQVCEVEVRKLKIVNVITAKK